MHALKLYIFLRIGALKKNYHKHDPYQVGCQGQWEAAHRDSRRIAEAHQRRGRNEIVRENRWVICWISWMWHLWRAAIPNIIATYYLLHCIAMFAACTTWGGEEDVANSEMAFFCRNLRWKLEGNTTVDESLISYNIVNIVLFVVIDLSGFLGHDQWHGLRHWTFPSRWGGQNCW